MTTQIVTLVLQCIAIVGLAVATWYSYKAGRSLDETRQNMVKTQEIMDSMRRRHNHDDRS